MTKPTPDEPTVPLKEYFEKMIALAKEAGSDALKIASDELARRLDALNGEAGRLANMQETYYPRQVAEPRLDQLAKDIRELQLSKAMLDGKASQTSFYIALVISLIGMLLSFCGLLIAITSIALRLIGL
jgi:hypothetical protein